MTDTYFGDEAVFSDEAVATGDATPDALPMTPTLSAALSTPSALSTPATLSWTDERVDLLRKLWVEGFSASRIAAELAGGVTRNAVIGKVHRLGLSGRVKAVMGDAARARPSAIKPAPGQPGMALEETDAPHDHASLDETLRGATSFTGGSLADGSLAAGSLAGNPLSGPTSIGSGPAGNFTAGAPQARLASLIPVRSSGDTMLPSAETVTIMDLRESMCRWPVGDPSSAEFRYCGSKAPIGAGPYCAHHSRMAYQPVQDRNRRRTA